MFLAALCGAVFGAIFLLFGPGYGWALAGQAFVLVPFMLYISFGWDARRAFFLRVGISWLSIVILNGVAAALQNLTGLTCLTFYAGIAVLMLARVLTELLMAAVKRQSRMYPTVFTQGEARVECMGLFDTGNLLSIPDTGEPVHIVSPAIIHKLGIDDAGGLRLIPFHALGTEQGWIRVMQVQTLAVHIGREEKVYCDAWLGVAEEALLAGKSYQAILHSSL